LKAERTRLQHRVPLGRLVSEGRVRDELRPRLEVSTKMVLPEVHRAALAVGQTARRRAPAAGRRRPPGAPSPPRPADHGVGPAADRLGELAAPPRSPRNRAGRPISRCVPSASRCTRSCRSGSWPARRRTGTRRAPWRARSLPTPVGPRNRNEPVGRSGSDTPARARRTASDTACTARVWPITRWPSSSSIRSSLAVSPSSSPPGRDAGSRRTPRRPRHRGRPRPSPWAP